MQLARPHTVPSRLPSRGRRLAAALSSCALIALVAAPLSPVAAKHGDDTGQVIVSPAVHSDTSEIPLSTTTPAPPLAVKDKKEGKKGELPEVPSGGGTDTVVQTQPGSELAPAPGNSFDGIGVGLGAYSPRWAPPDTEGAVGPNHYFAIVNADIAVFTKTGGLLYGPVPTNTLWAGFGGGCETRDDGDGIVEYDRLANRWVVTQFTNDGTNTECVAVSTTGDPLGTWSRYSFTYPAFPDYPKLSVWPDAYYITFNLFGSTGFAGGMVCAWDRTAMLAGAPATQQCFNLGTSFGGLLPSDLDGTTPPPAGSPDFVLNYGSNRLNLWKFHVDWLNSANTRLTGPTAVGVASFTRACPTNSTCVPQPATTQKLDSLSDRLMSRLAYRNFGDHESLVVNHSVGTGTFGTGPSAVRWYELRGPNGTPTVFQQGTYAPDLTYRWMGSIAMDKSGDIALGYSASSSSVRPSIAYTGRLASDPTGTMTQGEVVLQAGSGSQLPNLTRWGDYSSMTVDPADDCTFWYTNEYLKADGTFNWSTHISSFRFPGCGVSQVPTSIGVTPTSASVQTGGTQQFTATEYDQDSHAMSPQPTFTWSVNGGGTINQSGLFTAGSSAGTFTVTAASDGLTGMAHVTVTTVPADFTLSVTPQTVSVKRNQTAAYTVTISPVNGFAGSVTLTLAGQPSGSSVTFNPNPATTTSSLTVRAPANGQRGTFTLTVTGKSGALSHTATTHLTITK
jgi:hypothetical protein